MGKKTKKLSFWMRRKSHLPVLIIGTLVVLLLFFNEETSVKLNMEYQNRINELQQEIKLNEDSASYYRSRREAIETGTSDLEHVAREQFHMQRPTEDVFLIKE
jgi:predicted DNA-binding protein